MPTYCLLYFDAMYRVQEGREFNCETDRVAIEVAERSQGVRMIELWRDGSFLHKVDAIRPPSSSGASAGRDCLNSVDQSDYAPPTTA